MPRSSHALDERITESVSKVALLAAAEQPLPPAPQHRRQDDEGEDEAGHQQERSHELVPVRAYRERAEEVAVLLGQLEARGRRRAAPVREEDPGLGAALEDLCDGVARGLRGLERDLDGTHELAHQAVHVRV